MAKKISHFYEKQMRQALAGVFIYIFFIFHNTYEATFFKSEKKTDERHFKQMREGLGNK